MSISRTNRSTDVGGQSANQRESNEGNDMTKHTPSIETTSQNDAYVQAKAAEAPTPNVLSLMTCEDVGNLAAFANTMLREYDQQAARGEPTMGSLPWNYARGQFIEARRTTLKLLKATVVECPACGEAGRTCPSCFGAGEHHAPSRSNPYESATCTPCKGHGVVHPTGRAS